MEIEKLKIKLLELALKGKLVPQNINDKSVISLMDKIREERTRILKMGVSFEKCSFGESSDVFHYEKISPLVMSVSTLGKEVKTKDVLTNGMIPVISQSQNYIDGYTNDINKTIDCYPVILFGDHTRVVKYIDFSFAPGADGTKLFKSKCLPKYLYYLIMYAASLIENRGYGRHCALLKEKSVPFFDSIDKQLSICFTLDYVFSVVDNMKQSKENVAKLAKNAKQKILESIFDDSGSRNSFYGNRTLTTLEELIPDNNIGDGDWVLSEDMDDNGEYKIVQLKHVGFGKYIDKSYKSVNRKFYEEKSCSEICEKYLLINRLVSDSMNVCLLPTLPFKTITSVDVCWIAPSNEYNQKYLMYYLLSPQFQKRVMLKSSGSTRKRISKRNLVAIQINIHDRNNQDLIVKDIDDAFTILDSIEN